MEIGRPKPANEGGSGTGSGSTHSRLGTITRASYRLEMPDRLPIGYRVQARAPALALRFADHSFQATRIWLALKIEE